MKLEALEKSVLGCTICQQNFDLAIPQRRPHVLSCGHTFCGTCLQGDKRKCHNCRKISNHDAAINYQLENQIKAIYEYRDSFTSQRWQHLKKLSLCLDCKTPVLNSETETVDLLHGGHDVIQCEGASEPHLKTAFWLLDVLNRGNQARKKFEKVLQSILYVGAQYQKGLKTFIEVSSKGTVSDLIVDAWKDLLKKGPIPANHVDKDAIHQLKKMMAIESFLGPSIHKLAHKCSTLQQDNLFLGSQKEYEDFYTELTNDNTSGLNLFPNKKHLCLLPELRLRVISDSALSQLRASTSNQTLQNNQSLQETNF